MNARSAIVAIAFSSSFVVACTAAAVPSNGDGTNAPTRDPDPASSGASATPGGTSSPTTPSTPAPAGAVRLTADQHLRADRLTSVFENGTIDLQYDYIEDIKDGRGYTIGRGFTTSTGDAYDVIVAYVKITPNDALAQFIPELKRLSDQESGDTTGLAGFSAAWQAAAKTASMHGKEDDQVNTASYAPAAMMFDAIGGKLPLTLTVLYDTVFMHGDGDDPDGAPALIAAATTSAGGSPKTGIDEKVWLAAFIEARRADLANAHDPDTRVAWAEAVPRAEALRDLLDAGNMDLKGPVTVARGYDVTVP